MPKTKYTLRKGVQTLLSRFATQIPTDGFVNDCNHAFLSQLVKDKKLKVRPQFIRDVAEMPIQELRRRILVQADYHGKFARCLDGIKEIKHMPGAGVDGTRDRNQIRAICLALVKRALLAERKLNKLSKRC